MNQFDEHLARYRQEGISYLRANIPEIQRVESFADLKDLTLRRRTDLGEILILQYEATAPTLFPAVRKRLMEAGVANGHSILHTQIKNKGTKDEVYNVTMGFYAARLQISIDVHR